MLMNIERNVFRKNAYRKYQLWWMLTHNLFLDDLFDIVAEWDNMRADEDDYETEFSEYLFENGFHGELYVCFEEFLDHEYQDPAYMRQILDEQEFAFYLETEKASE